VEAAGGKAGGGRQVHRRERRKGQRAPTDAGAMRARNTTACEKDDGGVRVRGGLAQQGVRPRVRIDQGRGHEDPRNPENPISRTRARWNASCPRAGQLGCGPLAGLRGFSFFFIWLFSGFLWFLFSLWYLCWFYGSVGFFWFFDLLSFLEFFFNFNFLFENFDI
jgi:hypothetical protein